MIKEVLTKEELFPLIDDAVSQLTELQSSLDEKEINKVPYPNSWTAAQLLQHVTKSTTGMSKAMLAESKPANRNPAEKVNELKKIFLDFTNKLQSPEFIIPEEKTYHKQSSIEELNQSFEKLKESAGKANLDDIVEGLPFGPTTKLELLHFVLFHTERHLHQMRKIHEALKK